MANLEMDFDKYLKIVTNLNKYISFTCDVQNKRIDSKIPFNISTILRLKDIRSLEIEYFNKYEENGGATKIFELLLHSPPSKTWSLLGGELINLLQYWLEAIRKHLIIHNTHWWMFLKLILKFIKAISLKDQSLNKLLIEDTAECLLDLATHKVPDEKQRGEIIQTFNLISAEASRSIRFAYKEKFLEYFVKLSAMLATAGDLTLQYRMLESLLRWLLPRHEPAVRRTAAEKWFPEGRFTRRAVAIFLERPWQNFMKDARDFLNAQNESSDLVTSVICKTFSVGKHVCLSDKKDCWLDLNSSTKCISILLDPRWDALGGSGNHDTVLIHDENTTDVELKQESQQVVITAKVLDLSQVYPFSSDVIAKTMSCTDVRITVSSRCDIGRLDKFLSGIFGDKYKMAFNTAETVMRMSPNVKLDDSDVINATEEDTRFSVPPEIPRRKHSGYVVRPRNLGLWKSPSTISTSSLAQLHEKLAALPRYTFDKEPVSVCVLPQLSTVSEVSESDENDTVNSSVSTIKCRRYGVSYQRINKTDSKISHSTSEDKSEKRNLSPVVNDDENSISCLLLATIGSAEDSIVDDAIGRLAKNLPCNTDNIVDLLAQEALESNTNKNSSNTGDKKEIVDVQQKSHSQSENLIAGYKLSTEIVRDNLLPNEQPRLDESSNEIVENTPFSWVQVNRPKYNTDKYISKSNTALGEEPYSVKLIHNVDDVENFFSQHVIKNRNGEIVISPTLARKINETSSECSEDFDQCIFREDLPNNYFVQHSAIDQFFIPDADIVECVNAMVDRVCKNIDKCFTYVADQSDLREIDINTSTKRTRRQVTRNKNFENQDTHDSKSKDNTSKPKGKLTKTKSISCKKTSKNTKKRTKKEQPFIIMSPIIERKSVIHDMEIKNVESLVESPKSAVTTPLLRRKRKLYSPKDETCHEKTNIDVIETKEDDNTINTELKVCSKTPKSVAICYKQLEQERQNRIRKPQNRLSLKKPQLSVSPRTIKMNQIFDSLKDVIDGEPVKIADNLQLINNIAVYNYTSDSEEDDEKKNDTKSSLKKLSGFAKGSAETSTIHKSSKKIDKTIEVMDKRNNKAAKRTRKPRTKKVISKRVNENVNKIPDPLNRNLEDECMRKEAPEVLNTSLVIECTKNSETSPYKHLVPILNVAPQMECIVENNLKLDDENTKETQQKSKTKRTLSLKRNKDTTKVNLDLSMADHEGTISPLPGLVVETILTSEFDINDSVSANMFQKFKDIYKGKPVTDSEVNTTHNLLSDTNEPINYSPSYFNVTEEFNREDDKKHNESYRKETEQATKKKAKKLDIKKVKVEHKSQITKSHTDKELDVIQLSITESHSEKSMATMGSSHSPITAHGDFDEDPPNSTMLNEHIQPRIVEQEYLNQSIKDFFAKLTEQLHESKRENDIESVISLKDDNKTTEDRSNRDKNDSNISPVVIIARLSPEYIRSRASVNPINTNNSNTNCNSYRTSKACKDNLKNNKDILNNFEESDKISIKKLTGIVRSTISPITLCSDFQFKNAKTVTSSRSESEDNCIKRIKNIFSSKKQTTVQTNSMSNEMNRPTSSKRNVATSSPTSNEHLVEEHEIEEPSRSRTLDKSSTASKRKSSPIFRPLKRSKYGEENNNFGSTITESPSVSSVNEWFKRNEPTDAADNINLSIKENLKNVLEKLDTTLVEIHHNTSKRYINMFVDATTQLNEMKEKREQLQRQTASEIMSSVVKVVDEKFLQLNERLQLMDDQFMETLKKRAHDLIREECKQKRVMVTLLREDVESVLDHLEKARGSH